MSAIPMLVDRTISFPSMTSGVVQRLEDPPGGVDLAPLVVVPSSSTVNSSPPKRATVSPGRTAVKPLRDLDQQPVAGAVAQLSLTHLKRSTSNEQDRVKGLVALPARAREASTASRSLNSARLARPVRVS